MNIQELEKKTGITKQNIRFYERKELLHPNRNTANNYREYTEEDVTTLQKIRILRKLDVSIEDIREVLDGRIPLDQLMEKHLKTLKERQQELQAGISICKKLLHKELHTLNVDAVLQEMEGIEKKGGKFMSIIHDYRLFVKTEQKRSFSFVPDNMALTPAEFSEALFQFADENGLDLVITKESMYPVFTINGLEYTAKRRFYRFEARIHCTMTHPEELEDGQQEVISEKRRKWFRIGTSCLLPAFLLFYFIFVSESLMLGLFMSACLIPMTIWSFR